MREKITVKTRKKKEICDVTDDVDAYLRRAGASTGLCHIFVLHTTASISVADLDPGTDLDMLDAFQAMIPELQYRHPHNPAHVGDHIMSAIIGPGVLVPVVNGSLELGTWQRVILAELDGPRERNVVLTYLSC